MSDKPTVKELIVKVKQCPDFAMNQAAGWSWIIDRAIGLISELHPDLFASDPDPVEVILKMMCDKCNTQCNHDCADSQDDARRYVAELRRKAGKK